MSGAQRDTERLRDEEAREEARTVFDTPLILEAGAGTGKTSTLVARILTWCLTEGWERHATDEEMQPDDVATAVLDRVVAITFTEKAAAEMSHGVAEGLGDLLHGKAVTALPEGRVVADPDVQQLRARALLANVHRLEVNTIHGFCRRILRDHPLEAGVHPDFEVDAEGRAVRAIVEEVLADRLPEAYGQPGDDDLLALARMGVGAGRLGPQLESLASCPEAANCLAEDPLTPERVDSTRKRLAMNVAPLLQDVEEAFPGPPKGNTKVAHAVIACLNELAGTLVGTPTAEELIAAVQAATENASVLKRLKTWAKPEFTGIETKQFGDKVDQVAKNAELLAGQLSHLERVDAELLACARRALDPLLTETRHRMRRRGVQTFAGPAG